MSPGEDGHDAHLLRRARTVFVTATASVLGPAVVVAALDPPGRLSGLASPVSLVGLVSPVIGYRLYLLLRERRRGFLAAGIAAMAVTEGVALLGIVTYALSGTLSTMIGVLTHVLLVGAIWPSHERLEAFREISDGPG